MSASTKPPTATPKSRKRSRELSYNELDYPSMDEEDSKPVTPASKHKKAAAREGRKYDELKSSYADLKGVTRHIRTNRYEVSSLLTSNMYTYPFSKH